MTAPDHVVEPPKNFLPGRGHPYMALVVLRRRPDFRTKLQGKNPPRFSVATAIC